MIKVRRNEERGHEDHGWLNTYHTFSFADYYDPNFMGFRSLRVINEDRVAPGEGFGTHGHRDMEILTYVLEGSIAHKDSMGHQQVLGPNEIQRMSAGTGIRHSEFNPSTSERLHFFQIWIEPGTTGTQPSYEQIRFDPEEKKNMAKGAEIPYSLGAHRSAWVHVVRGEAVVNGMALRTGDAAAISGEEHLSVTGKNAESSEILLFDLG